ncbi:MAG TPA: TIGR03435 family protein [Vicinamibacterales bacterium]|nr:TIGR03435 family protein [Vicinamibacterales bacterium]
MERAASDPCAAPAVDPNGPPIFTAVQERLGLKLVPDDGGVPVLVIDHVEHPTPD